MKYNIKRFSKNFEQREFGIIQDINRSGLKRTLKRNIGRTRTKLANKIYDSIKVDKIKGKEAVKSAENLDKINNPKIDKKLKEIANKSNTDVLGIDYDSSGRNYMVKTKHSKSEYKNLREIGGRRNLKIARSGNKHDYQIFHPNGSGTDGLSHEIGHVKNSISKNPITRTVNKIASSEDAILGHQGKKKSEKGIKSIVNRYIKEKAVINEEKRATKKGLSLLKNSGMTKNELTSAKKSLDAALNTHKIASKVSSKYPLMNTIQIPSRRIKK